MPTCPRKRFVRLGAKKPCERFQTSYERSYYYQSPIPWSLQKQEYHDLQCKTELKTKSIKRESPSEHYMSSYNKEYKLKIIEDRSESYGRSSIAGRPTLKNLCEKFIKDPVRPLIHSTTSGSTYVRRKIPFESSTLSQTSPTDDATCPIVDTGKHEFPTIPLNELSFYKHLDPLVTTTQMTHINFTSNEKISSVGKNIEKRSKCHHFLPKTIPTKGPLSYPRCTDNPPLVYPKRLCVIPYKAYTTTYSTHYDYVLTNLLPWHTVVKFPTVFKLSRNDVYKTPSMYRTEQCHVGTGWPIRAAINLGPIKLNPRQSAHA
ncbi:hypothetical protein HZH68_002740 [Vespula germanica]|uniref:Uncharacterized protein n=1 Tax=Vespula germanica TaxID=30212 RepID=A0A834U1F1_VESGE|nr:hypothetical protein HZH68_002740 [Vespula germanica]